ncbi:MAG: hypothetical protein KGY99_03760 [Phycisphaerae bacterium]|nr:hypothetical protein [Phycisphaerae bacterium]
MSEHDRQLLSTWLDGELPPDQAEQVARAVRDDAAWAEAADALRALDGLLASHRAPTTPTDLPERIREVVATRRRRPAAILRMARWAVPAAAAAAAIVVAITYLPTGDTTHESTEPTERTVSHTTRGILAEATDAEREQLVELVAMEQLDMFRDYDVVTHYETLVEIERIERSGKGGI